MGPLEIRAPTPDARCVEASLPSLGEGITPTRKFFIRSHFAVPLLKPETWRLAVEGAVEHPLVLGWEGLRSLPFREVTATLECAGNSRSTVRPRPEGVLWGHGAIGTGRFGGVSLGDVLARARPRRSAREVVLSGADRGKEPGVEGALRYEMSVDLAKAMDPDTLLAFEMNGAPLLPAHGFPVRAVVPGYYGMASVKWLTRVEVVDRPFTGYFRARAYTYIREGQRTAEPRRPVTTLNVKSLITRPGEGEVLAPGRYRIRGVAWSAGVPIARVEVSTSPVPEGPASWRTARLTPSSSRYAWTRWELDWEAREPGFYIVRARATDATGATQPEEAEWNFRGVGNNSVHAVPVEVRARGPRTRA